MLDHGDGAAVAFDLTLWEMAKVGNLGADEKYGGGVGACSHTGTATDAGGGVHGEVGVLFLDWNGVAVWRAAGGSGNEAASGNDAVESTAIDSKILDVKLPAPRKLASK